MKIKKALLVLFILNFPLFSSLKISKINIIGNKNISEEKIFLIMKMRKGSDFNEEMLKKDIENLIKTGYFRKIDYSIEETEEGLMVNIKLEENPIIEKINFEGNKVFKTKKLKNLIGIKEGEILIKEKLEEGIEKIKNEYYKKGYPLCEIGYEIKESEGKSVIFIKINEKGKIFVEKILFEGNEKFTSKRLKKLIKTKERRMPFIKGTYKEETLKADVEKIKNFYTENGFMEVKVDQVVESGEKGLIVKFLINEGKIYYTGDIKLEGNLIFDIEEVKKNILLKEGEVFNSKKNEESIRNLHQFYSDKGYIKCNVEYFPEVKENKINITYFIEPESKYYTEEIKIKGNRITKDKVIRREIKIEPGDEITGEKIRKSFNNLRDTNYFEEIKIYPETVEEGKANIIVDVKEREKTGFFLIGGGYSSIDKFIGMVSIQQLNFDITNPPKFVGGGQQIALTFEIGSTKRNYMFSFTEPYLFDRPVYFGPDIYRLTKIWDDWTERATGFDLRIGRRWENFTLGFKFISENTELTDIEIPFYEEGEWKKNSLVTSLTFSNLDSERFPKKGDKLRFAIEYAGIGGDLNFMKTTIENHYYYPFKNIIFHSKTLAGYIDRDVPLYERFFGGGIGTVRGYIERGLGPKEYGYNVGGNVIFAQNFEILYPLYQDIFYGILFFDIGNVFKDWSSIDELKKGIGIGIKVNYPFFPIEIYYGYGLDAEPGEKKGRFHIGISFGF
ncbi:MAG: outer membrane protein assembly factor BamA [Candidatus Omnitrophica bacterium]|nr:outer membrane protein assembly factor BamA [Candidatus Omnitrophota bacterium]